MPARAFGPVPLEYSIAWLICVVICGREAVMVGWRVSLKIIYLIALPLPKTSSALVGADAWAGRDIACVGAGEALARPGMLWHGVLPCFCDWPTSV